MHSEDDNMNSGDIPELISVSDIDKRMTPKMDKRSSRKTTYRIKFEICLTVLLLIFIVVFFWLFFQGYRIPELERLDKVEADRYSVYCASYDGKEVKWVSQYVMTSDEGKELIEAIHKFNLCRGVKVNNWTKDKITYPIYALTVRPEKFKGPLEIGETVVWTNGYLITSSGDVYKCSPDFSPFLEADDNDYVSVTELNDISHTRTFRPLTYANCQWNTDLLVPSGNTPDKRAPGVEAEVTEVGELSSLPFITISLKNTGDTKWNYEDYSLFIALEVNVDGEYYYIFHDPTIDDDIRTIPGYSNVIEPSCEDTLEISLGFYGILPPGDYRIIIYGMTGEDYTFASADYFLE